MTPVELIEHIKVARDRHEFCMREVSRLSKISNDVVHAIEFCNLNGVQMVKAAKKLRDVTRLRRAFKEEQIHWANLLQNINENKTPYKGDLREERYQEEAQESLLKWIIREESHEK